MARPRESVLSDRPMSAYTPLNEAKDRTTPFFLPESRLSLSISTSV